MIIMNKTLFEEEIKSIVTLSKESGAKKVLLFGSCVANPEEAQDIDVAVSGVPPESFFDLYGKILAVVKDEVDLLPFEDLDGYFAERITETGKIIYER